MSAVSIPRFEVGVGAFPDTYRPIVARLKREGQIIGTEQRGSGHLAIIMKSGQPVICAATPGDRKATQNFISSLKTAGANFDGWDDKPRKEKRGRGRPLQPSAPGWPTTLRKRRLDGGLTQEAVASLIGVGGPVVASWENGKKEPGEKSIEALKDLFGDDLFGEEPKPKAGTLRDAYPNVPAPSAVAVYQSMNPTVVNTTPDKAATATPDNGVATRERISDLLDDLYIEGRRRGYAEGREDGEAAGSTAQAQEISRLKQQVADLTRERDEARAKVRSVAEWAKSL